MPGDESALIAVLDTSVAVRWLVRERGSDEVGRLMERPITWWAPHLIITEIVAAMRRKIVASELSVANAVASMHILKAAVVDGFVVLVADDELAPSALTLALTCEHNVPDRLYLALAERDDFLPATADIALSKIAEKRGLSVRFISSS